VSSLLVVLDWYAQLTRISYTPSQIMSKSPMPALVSYRLMHTTPVQGLHGAVGCTWIIVLNEAIVVPLSLRRTG
jgi:hypothetical protein